MFMKLSVKGEHNSCCPNPKIMFMRPSVKGEHNSCPNSKIMFMRPSVKGNKIVVVLIQKSCLRGLV